MQAQDTVVVSGSDDSSSDSEAGADIGAEDSPDSSDSHQQSPPRVDRKLGSEEVEEEDALESMDQQQLPTSAKRKKKKKSKAEPPAVPPQEQDSDARPVATPSTLSIEENVRDTKRVEAFNKVVPATVASMEELPSFLGLYKDHIAAWMSTKGLPNEPTRIWRDLLSRFQPIAEVKAISAALEWGKSATSIDRRTIWNILSDGAYGFRQEDLPEPKHYVCLVGK
jgi:hypothetical protein